MVGGLAGGLDEFVHDMRRGGQVGVAHPQIDDVFALAPGLHLDVVDRGENIGGQALHAGEFFNGHAGLSKQTKRYFQSVKLSEKAGSCQMVSEPEPAR